MSPRGPTQRLHADVEDWCQRKDRRIHGMNRGPGTGKAIKNRLVRQARRKPIPRPADPDY